MPPSNRPRRARADSAQATRTALIDAALGEFAEHGFDVPSLDAICARAGYTRGAFYVHFRDRAELMSAVVEQVMGLFLETIVAHGDAASDLSRTIERFADAVVQTLEAPRRGVAPAIPLPPLALPRSGSWVGGGLATLSARFPELPWLSRRSVAPCRRDGRR